MKNAPTTLSLKLRLVKIIVNSGFVDISYDNLRIPWLVLEQHTVVLASDSTGTSQGKVASAVPPAPTFKFSGVKVSVHYSGLFASD